MDFRDKEYLRKKINRIQDIIGKNFHRIWDISTVIPGYRVGKL